MHLRIFYLIEGKRHFHSWAPSYLWGSFPVGVVSFTCVSRVTHASEALSRFPAAIPACSDEEAVAKRTRETWYTPGEVPT